MVSRKILVVLMMIGRAAALFAFAPSSKSWFHTVPARVCSLSKWDAKPVQPKVLCRTNDFRNSRRSYATTMQEHEGTAGSGREDSLDRKILSIALPALGSLAIDPLLGLVDTLYLGQIPDARPLAALGVCTSVFNFAFFIFNFFATATTPLVSRAIAAGDKDSAIKTLGQAFTAALAIGLLSACAIEGFAPRILSAMSTSAEAMGDANGYLRVRALATPAVLLASVANGAFRGVQNTMTPLKILVAANVINFVLDPLLIFGVHIGDFDLLPPLGATGAAIATAVAEWGGCAALLISLNQQAPLAGAVKLMDSMPKWQEAEPLLRASGAVFVRSITLQTVLTSATAEAARVGTTAVAAHQVALQLWLLLSFLVDALAVAAQTLVAEELGKGSISRARQVADRLLQLALALGVALLPVFAIGGGFVARAFSADKDVVGVVQHLLLYVAVMQPVNALVFVGDGIGQGSSDFTYLSGAMAAAGGVALVILFAGEPNMDTVWQSLVCLQLLRAGGLAWRYYGGKSARGPLTLDE